jgi:uncharacterized protein YbcI
MAAEEAATEEPGARRDQSELMEISNAMVRLYKEQFGRGPTKARTHWAGPNTIVSVLDDTLTRAERNMVKLGEHQRLRDVRIFFQYATVKDFCDAVENITGRRVQGFHSSIDPVVDGQAVEVFVLYPEGQEGPSRSEFTKT